MDRRPPPMTDDQRSYIRGKLDPEKVKDEVRQPNPSSRKYERQIHDSTGGKTFTWEPPPVPAGLVIDEAPPTEIIRKVVNDMGIEGIEVITEPQTGNDAEVEWVESGAGDNPTTVSYDGDPGDETTHPEPVPAEPAPIPAPDTTPPQPEPEEVPAVTDTPEYRQTAEEQETESVSSPTRLPGSPEVVRSGLMEKSKRDPQATGEN